MRRSPARLVIALSVAAALAVFILYTSIAGAGTPQIVPSQIHRFTRTRHFKQLVLNARALDVRERLKHCPPDVRRLI